MTHGKNTICVDLRKRLIKLCAWGLLLLSLSICGAGIAGAHESSCSGQGCAPKSARVLDSATEETLEINGESFVGPKTYFSSGRGGAVFYWPSKAPMTNPPISTFDFYKSAIEIFFLPKDLPNELNGFSLIKFYESKNWVEKREKLTPGLERIRMKHVLDHTGLFADRKTYYVAVNIKGTDGLPPVASCNHSDEKNFGGSRFYWKPGIQVGISFNQSHCSDWPDIYQESLKVLSLLKRNQ